jgi:hypothetical protein
MRKSVALPLVLAAFLAAPVLAQDAPPADPRCQTAVCRKPGTSLVQLREGGQARLPRPAIPYFTGSVLSLTPGETIVLGFSHTADGSLSAPVLVDVRDENGAVESGPRPAAEMTVSFSLRQAADKPDMMLTVVNQTDLMIKYDAHMYVPANGKVSSSATTSCPVMPKLLSGEGFTVFEAWPHPIFLLLIGQVQTLRPDATRICS